MSEVADDADGAVVLEVFDLSFGLTGHLSENILGTRVEGIFHTNVSVFGYSYFFSNKIQRMTSAEFQRMFGRPPVKTIVCGTTNLTRETFEAYLHSDAMSERFSARNYNLFQNNCNDFSKACLTFLLPGVELSQEVHSVLDNASIIMNSPNTVAARSTLQEAGTFFTRLLQTLGQNHNLNVSEQRNVVGGENLTAELAITGLLDIVENLANSAARNNNNNNNNTARNSNSNTNTSTSTNSTSLEQRPQRPQLRVQRQNSATSVQLARNVFDTFANLASLLPAVQTIARQNRNTNNENNNRNLSRPNTTVQTSVSTQRGRTEESESETVELRAEVLELLESVFSESDESVVLKTVRNILQKEGYYSLASLKGITETDLVGLGVKKGWARKLKAALDKYFE